MSPLGWFAMPFSALLADGNELLIHYHNLVVVLNAGPSCFYLVSSSLLRWVMIRSCVEMRVSNGEYLNPSVF